MSENFWEDDGHNNYNPKSILGRRPLKETSGLRNSYCCNGSTQFKQTINNSNKQLILMQLFSPNKRPADPIANVGRKKKTANICGGLVHEPHRKHKLISMYHAHSIIGPNVTYDTGEVGHI
jgi:hypothetical protein